jgi:hypothetical protein
MFSARKESMIKAISQSGDRYGGGPNGLLQLMDETSTSNTRDVTEEQLEDFCKRHGIQIDTEKENERMRNGQTHSFGLSVLPRR